MSGSVVRSSSADVRELSGRCISPHLHPPTADLMAGVISASRRPHLALDGDDLLNLSLQLRKNNLACLLARRADGIHLAPFEQGEIRSGRTCSVLLRHDAGRLGFETPG